MTHSTLKQKQKVDQVAKGTTVQRVMTFLKF